MKWEQETWRKLYVRVDAKWLSLPVSARGLGSELLKYADDNGDLHLGSDPPGVAVAFLLSARPKEHRRIADDLNLLMSPEHRFMVQIGPGAYRIRNFVDAQAKSGSAKRMALKRARDAARQPVTVTPNVTSHGDDGVQNESVNGDANEVTDPIRSDPIRSPLPPKGCEPEDDAPAVGHADVVWLRALRLAGAAGIDSRKHERARGEIQAFWLSEQSTGTTWAQFVDGLTRDAAEWVGELYASGKWEFSKGWPWGHFAAWLAARDVSRAAPMVAPGSRWGDPDADELAAGGSSA